MNNVFFSSDFHYGHTNIAGPKISSWPSGYRDFDSVSDMNKAIVSSINNTVDKDDVLFFLGDWSLGGKENVENFRKQVNCRNIIIILGNHDHHIGNMFSERHYLLNTTIKGHSFSLCHYAMRVWPKSHHGAFHLYGHSHHTIPDNYGRSMDVGWCKYRRPLSLEEVVETLKSRPIKVVDHHDSRTNP